MFKDTIERAPRLAIATRHITNEHADDARRRENERLTHSRAGTSRRRQNITEMGTEEAAETAAWDVVSGS